MNSSRTVLLLFTFLSASMPWHACRAVPVDDLYVAEVLVTDESARQLRIGARAGLLQVLVRLSGQLDIENSSPIRNSLRSPGAYYYQFSYGPTDETLIVDGEEVQARRLRLHFEPSAVAALLREANLPVWGSNRPAVLFWIALNDGNDRRLLSEADASSLVRSLADQARQRGLPVILPILDLEDASQISVAEVWGGFQDRVERASVRYRPDILMSARVQQEPGGGWTGRWSYRLDQGWQSSETAALTSDDLVRSMVNVLVDEIAERYAISSARGRVHLLVEGVGEVSDYASLSSYLEQLTPVLSSSIVSLQGDVAGFELQVEGEAGQLVEIIKLDGRLSLLNRDAGSDRLHYQWTRQQ